MSKLGILVVGGNGFVGSHVCKQALKQGLAVRSFNRSGSDNIASPLLKDEVEWIRGDVRDEDGLKNAMRDCNTVISTIGLISLDQRKMEEVNGTLNATVIKTAKNNNIEKFVFISEASVPLQPSLGPFSGYFSGKQYAEEILQRYFPEMGYIIRPGVMHGWRTVSTNLSIPLHFSLWPAQKIASMTAVLVPPSIKNSFIGKEYNSIVPVESVAKAVIHCAIRNGKKKIWEAEDIRQFD